MIGDRIRKLREQRGFSLRQLARLAKIPHETISRLENNQQRFPSLPVAIRLAKTLGVTLDYLAGMYEDDDEEPAYLRRRAVA
ncbi:MAG TPA: helix-turn-helix transcriptional regulator [Candidatus Tectomicrobia bacterium]